MSATFLSLPMEVKRIIYSMVLQYVRPEPNLYRSHSRQYAVGTDNERARLAAPSLMFVSRRVTSEVLPIHENKTDNSSRSHILEVSVRSVA